MNATEYLKQVRIAEQEMNAELRKAELYRSLTERVTTALGGEQVTHTRNVTAMEDAILGLIDSREQLYERTKEYNAIVTEVARKLRSITVPYGEQILYYHYIEHCSLTIIAKKIYVSRTQVYRCHNDAIRELDELLSVTATPEAADDNNSLEQRDRKQSTTL